MVMVVVVMVVIVMGGQGGWGSSAWHHRGDGPTSSLGHVSMGKEQKAVYSDGLVVEVEAAVLVRSSV